MSNLAERESRMIQLLTVGTRIALVAVAMVLSIPAITSAQTTEPAIESSPEADTGAVDNALSTPGAASTDNDMSAQSDPPAAPEIKIQQHFNDLRRELLEDREKLVDWWLIATATFLTLFGLGAVGAGYLGFKGFQEIKAEARQNVTASKQYAEEARSLVEEIKAKRDEAESIVEDAEVAANNPAKTKQAVKDVRENPKASLTDKAKADAVYLQQQGKRDDAVKKWRAIAHVAKGSDNDLAASAWFSIGYLLHNEDTEDAMAAYDQAIRLKPDYAAAYSNRGFAKAELGRREDAIADYDQAIRLKPDYTAAYSNRGIVKAELGRSEDAIADYDEAIRLKPDLAEAYYNRGNAKAVSGLKDEARKDFKTALELVRNTNNANLVAKVEQSLRNLDDADSL